MPASRIFLCSTNRLGRNVSRIAAGLPNLIGRPIEVHAHPGLYDAHGPVHAGSFLRERRIAVNCSEREFPRIFVHEVFHFVWLRLGNAARRSFEELVEAELVAGARGELGWSAEWRKLEIDAHDRTARTRRWREYCCEAFCDTAAWRYAGLSSHPEFTLAERYRSRRRRWLEQNLPSAGLSI